MKPMTPQETRMKNHPLHLLAAAIVGLSSFSAQAQVVGVSWSNFQEERWKTDEKAIKDQLAKSGASYVSADAGGSPRAPRR
jgi:D-xylose transport system substrate-binding protein